MGDRLSRRAELRERLAFPMVEKGEYPPTILNGVFKIAAAQTGRMVSIGPSGVVYGVRFAEESMKPRDIEKGVFTPWVEVRP